MQQWPSSFPPSSLPLPSLSSLLLPCHVFLSIKEGPTKMSRYAILKLVIITLEYLETNKPVVCFCLF